MKDTSKVYLISQEADNLTNSFTRPVHKKLIEEFKDGKAIHNEGNEGGVGPVYFPVGYVIEHPKEGEQSRASSWQEYSKGFAVPTYIHGYPIISGSEISNLEGRLLTVIDAAFADKDQRESIKSLVRDTIWKFNSEHERKVVAMYESLKDIK